MVELDLEKHLQAWISDRHTGLTLAVLTNSAEIRQAGRLVLRGMGEKAKSRVVRKFERASMVV